jgi:hypothetical protein
VPLIHEAKKCLKDEKFQASLLYPFWAGSLLVDLANNVFLSHTIRNKLYNDPLVHWIRKEQKTEKIFEYRLPDGFYDVNILKPTAFLLDRLSQQLQNPKPSKNIEGDTARLFLACCSFLDTKREGKL